MGLLFRYDRPNCRCTRCTEKIKIQIPISICRIGLTVHPEQTLIDMHDNMKLDAPSGTSKQIAEIISKKLDFINKDYTYGRNGIGKRKANSIAFNSIRSGGLPGSIKVIFGYENERLELSAHVYNMNTYANGMMDAGSFLVGKRPGLYSLKEIFSK